MTGRAGAVAPLVASAVLSEPRGFELHALSSEVASWVRVDVVEVDDAIRREAVIGSREFEIETSPRAVHAIAALPTQPQPARRPKARL
jgi:hypothetical protein